MRYLVYLCIICSFKQVAIGQSQGVTNSQTKLRPNQLRWSPTDATLDSVYIIRADTATGEPGWYLVTFGGGGNADTTLAGDVVGGLNSTFVRKINGVTVENKTPQGREVLQYDGTQWTPDSIDLADLPQMNASRVLGRGSSSAGAVTQLTPSNGVKISGNYIESDLTAGTGINISGTTTLTVSNSAPDQTVTISGATGTYPNFTVTPTAPGGSSGQVQYNNAGSFGALDSFTVASNPDRLGVGVPVPTARVDIQGSGSTSATNALRVRNSAGTELLSSRNDGTTIIRDVYFTSNQTRFGPTSSLIGNYSGYVPALDVQVNGTTSIGLRIAQNSTTLATQQWCNGSYVALSNMSWDGRLALGSSAITTVGLLNNFATTASTPSMLLSGTGYSGGTATTTKPTFLIEPTGTTSTGWNTNGTKLGVNAESGFTGNLLDLQVNGVSKIKFNEQSGGAPAITFNNTSMGIGVYNNGVVIGSSSGAGLFVRTFNLVTMSNVGVFGWTAGGGWSASHDVGISRVGTTGTTLAIGNGTAGDYSGFMQDNYRRIGSGSPESVVTAPVGAVYHRTDGGAGTSFYVKESGTGNTGWIAK